MVRQKDAERVTKIPKPRQGDGRPWRDGGRGRDRSSGVGGARANNSGGLANTPPAQFGLP